MPISQVKNVFYVVADLDRSVRFYRDQLNLAFRFQEGARWSQFEVGGTTFALSSPDEAGASARTGVVTFETTELEQTLATLSTEDRRPRIRDMGTHGRTAAILDPDGNIVQLFERAT
jgi:catechol 2,3-dioxygenase-like lactoylglutathione lyase family enzyme